MTTDAPILSLRGIRRSFGPVEVLHGVDLDLRPGEVHALLGENGAGKSTLMKILAGHQPPSSGQILLDGKLANLDSPHDGEAAGIIMIHQEFALAEQLSVEQNIFLGRELRRGLLLDKRRMRALTRDYLSRVSAATDPDAPVSGLSNAEKQMVEIAKALSRNARVLIMDEPTAVLTSREVAILFDQVRALRAAGTAILFTSHKLDEVAALADRVTIMRDGAVVYSGPAAGIDEHGMANAMVGREMSDLYPPKPGLDPAAPVALKVSGLRVPRYAHGLDFEVRRGEILGLAGLVGAGRTEAMEGLCGIRPTSGGAVGIHGKPATIRNPSDALALRLCYLTEDRKLRGLLLEQRMQPNLTLQALRRFTRLLVDRRAEAEAMDEAVREFDIRGSREVPVGNLSGGNQQKLLLAKIMLSEPEILIVDEPTRGIDIGTKQQIYAYLRRLAAEGHAIIVISSEMQELIGLADRILVMRAGRQMGILEGAALREDAIVRLALGVTETTAAAG